MKLKLVKIGNSQGIRIPKPIIDQCGLGKEVELETDGTSIVIRASKPKARKGWAKAFQQMHEAGDDKQVWQAAESEIASSWDQEEWEWE